MKFSVLIRTMAIWSIYWMLVIGGTIYLLPRFFSTDQLQRSWLTSLYFLIFSIFSCWVFRFTTDKKLCRIWKYHLAPMLILALSFITASYLTNSLFPLSVDAHHRILDSKLNFPLFVLSASIPKVFDVTFQQITIFCLLNFLLEKGLKKESAINIFFLIFFLLHTPFIFQPTVYVVTLVLPSFFAGFIFPYLILNFRFGLVYTYGIHLFFYYTAGLALRNFL